MYPIRVAGWQVGCQYLPVGEEVLPFVLQKYRLDDCINIASQFYQSLSPGGGTAVMRWVVPRDVSKASVEVQCAACGEGGLLQLLVYRGAQPSRQSGDVLNSLSIQLSRLKQGEVVFIQLSNHGTKAISGINVYIIANTLLIDDHVTASRNQQGDVPRYDFNIRVQLPANLYIPRGGAVIVRFEGDRRLGDNYIRYGSPVEYDTPDGVHYRDKFDIWAQHFKTYGDELILCPPKFEQPYYVSARSYWENTIVNYKITYGVLYPFEKLQ